MAGGGDARGSGAEVRAYSPRAGRVGRLAVEPQDYGGEPEAAAAALVARQLPQLLQHPYVDYWEGWNLSLIHISEPTRPY